MKLSLYDWQIPHYEKLLQAVKNRRVAIDTSDTGCGKSPIALAIAEQLKVNFYVICPASLRTSWRMASEKFGVTPTEIMSYETARRGVPGLVTKSGSGKKVKFEWSVPPGSLFIFDEAQACKGRESLNSALLAAAAPFRVLMASATLIESPIDLNAIGFVTGLHGGGNDYWKFCRAHGCSDGMWGGLVFMGTKSERSDHMNRIHSKLKEIKAGIKKSELGDNFQINEIQCVPIDVRDPKAVDRLYEKIGGVLKDLAEVTAEYTPTPLTANMAERQAIETMKLPYLAESAKELIAEGNSVCIFVNYRASASWLERELLEAYNPSLVIGGLKDSDRKIQIERFQTNQTQLCILTIDSGGAGLNLHDEYGGHPRVSLISPDYDGRAVWQCLGRIHRAGAKTPALQRIVFCADTVEEQVRRAYEEKIKMQQMFNQGLPQKGERKEMQKILKKEASKEDFIHIGSSPIKVCSEAHEVASVYKEVVKRSEDGGSNPERNQERPHAEYSPSTLNYREACPSWVSHGVAGDAAFRGTLQHECCEKENPDDGRLEPHEKEAVKLCLAYRDSQKFENGSILTEIEIKYHDQFGYLDLALFDSTKTKCRIIDWKFGAGSILDAEINRQGHAYAVGLWNLFPSLNEIEVHFIMPHQKKASKHHFFRKDYDILNSAITMIVERAKIADTRNAGEQCAYCKHIGTCSVVINKLNRFSAIYDGVPLPKEVHGSQITSPEDMATALHFVGTFQKASDGIKHAALSMWEDQHLNIPGYERATRKGAMKVTSTRGAIKQIEKVLGQDLSTEDIMSFTTITVTNLEDFISKSVPKGSAKGTLEEVKEALMDVGAAEQSAESRFLKRVKS